MVELCGSGYVVEHCISVLAKEADEKLYRNYIAECLRCISESTAKIGGGSYITAKYADLVNPKAADNRTGDEVALDVFKRAGLTLKGGDGDGISG